MSDHELDQQQYVEHLDERDAELTHLANQIAELEGIASNLAKETRSRGQRIAELESQLDAVAYEIETNHQMHENDKAILRSIIHREKA